MPGPLFYLHEDDWGMINLIPAENAAWAGEIREEAIRAAEENFAGHVQLGDAQIPTYHDIYVIPEEKHPISERAIPLQELRNLLSDKWPEAEKVVSGYGSYSEDIGGAFAFGEAEGASGAFYGSYKEGVVAALHIVRPDYEETQAVREFDAALLRLGEEYNLVLVDWWRDVVLNLRNAEGIRRYLIGEA